MAAAADDNHPYERPAVSYFNNLSEDTGLGVQKLVKLHKLYYDYNDSPAAFKGIGALFRESKARNLGVTKAECVTFLKSQPTYTLYRPARRRVEVNRIRIETVGK